MIKKCEYCGKEYEAKTSRSMYCTLECRRSSDRDRKRNRYQKSHGIGELRKCDYCGEMFEKKQYNSRFCCRKCENNYYQCERQKRIPQRIPKEAIVDKDITLEKIIKRDKGICYLCGEKVIEDDRILRRGRFIYGRNYPSIDHVIPISKGGLHSWNNVRLAHIGCNCSKQNKILENRNGK